MQHEIADPVARRRALHARWLEARAVVASFLGADSDHTIFTSGGTEADARALHAHLEARTHPHVICSALDHPATRATLAAWHDEGRIRLQILSPDATGQVTPGALHAALRADTALVCLTMACSETGILQPVREVAHVCHAHDVPLHVDAVQAAPFFPVSLGELGASSVAISGHKLGAVAGIGALALCNEAAPMTNNLAPPMDECAGLAASLAAAVTYLSADAAHEVGVARDALERAVTLAIPDVCVVGAAVPRVPGTSCMRFSGCAADGLMMALDLAGIAVSTGTACSSGSVEPSRSLLAMGLTPVQANETLRFSLRASLAQPEIERVAQALSEIVGRARHSA